MSPLTAAERKAAQRARQAAEGLSKLEVWAPKRLHERIKKYVPPPRKYPRGYYKMFAEHIRQANEGCDFDFLEGNDGIPEPEIH